MLKYQERECVHVHLDKITSIVAEIKSAGSQILEDKANATILRSFPKLFEHHIVVLEGCNNVDLQYMLNFLRVASLKRWANNCVREISTLKLRDGS